MTRTIANQGVMTMSTTMVKKLKMIDHLGCWDVRYIPEKKAPESNSERLESRTNLIQHMPH